MSLVNLSYVCSHLQNASKARLGLTSIPFTKLHLHLSHQLQKSGFVSTVTLAGMLPPPASSLLAHPPAPSLVDSRQPFHTATHLPRVLGPLHPPSPSAEPKIWELASLPENLSQPDLLEEQIPANPAQRRLWLGLKYWNNEPVLSKMSMISKPTRRIWMTSKELGDIALGRRTGYVHGMRQVGECMFVTTDRGIMEIRECVEREVGGMVLCRAW